MITIKIALLTIFLLPCFYLESNPLFTRQEVSNNLLNTGNTITTGTPEDISGFIPDNYTLLDSVHGDLNLDPYTDLILVLKKNGEDTVSDVDNPEKRPLLILISQPDKTYKLAKRNDNTVYCYNCGGMMGDPYTGITIKKGYFSVEHYGGSAWRWVRIITYKYSKENNEWYLHKDGYESFHASEPEKVDSRILTTKDFGIVPFERFDIYKGE